MQERAILKASLRIGNTDIIVFLYPWVARDVAELRESMEKHAAVGESSREVVK